jgi:predicted HicB family RNase H-like nuclease
MEQAVSKERRTPTRIIFQVPEEFHRNIKARATLRGMSITTYVLQALIEKIEREKAYE